MIGLLSIDTWHAATWTSQATLHGHDIVVKAGAQPSVAAAGAVIEVERVRHQRGVVALPHQVKLAELEGS